MHSAGRTSPSFFSQNLFSYPSPYPPYLVFIKENLICKIFPISKPTKLIKFLLDSEEKNVLDFGLAFDLLF